mgnify:CR=1 FL=1
MEEHVWDEPEKKEGRLKNPRGQKLLGLLVIVAVILSLLLLIFMDEVFGFIGNVFGEVAEQHLESTDIPTEQYDLEGENLLEDENFIDQTPDSEPYY